MWLDRGDFPENLHIVCPSHNKKRVLLNLFVFGSSCTSLSSSPTSFLAVIHGPDLLILGDDDDDDEVMLNVLRCQLTY